MQNRDNTPETLLAALRASTGSSRAIARHQLGWSWPSLQDSKATFPRLGSAPLPVPRTDAPYAAPSQDVPGSSAGHRIAIATTPAGRRGTAGLAHGASKEFVRAAATGGAQNRAPGPVASHRGHAATDLRRSVHQCGHQARVYAS